MSKKAPIDLVCSFVEKSGGLARVEEAIEAMKDVKDRGDITGFVTRISKRPDGAQQLFAAALLGMTMAAMTYRATGRNLENN